VERASKAEEAVPDLQALQRLSGDLESWILRSFVLPRVLRYLQDFFQNQSPFSGFAALEEARSNAEASGEARVGCKAKKGSLHSPKSSVGRQSVKEYREQGRSPQKELWSSVLFRLLFRCSTHSVAVLLVAVGR